MNDIERLLILNMVEEVGSLRIQNLLKHFGALEKVFEANENELRQVTGVGPVIAPKIIQSIKEIDLGPELKLIKGNKVKIVTFLDENYPANLRNIYAPPVVLYVKGEVLPQDDIAVAIVGSRLASFYGLQQAERFGFELASRGITIVSGLARGIDSSSHKGALKAKGRTLAILGSGIANIYPEEHKDLADQISNSGAIISEFPMMTIPDRGNFPKRNRIISGLSLGIVVVEASEKSGALITADYALEQGKDVFSVPGKVDSVTSKGTNKLIKQGARLVETVDDILEELNLEGQMSHCESAPDVHLQSRTTSGLDKEESLVYNLLSNEPQHIDELAEQTKIGISEISRVLFNLEIKKFIRQIPGKNFIKL